MSRFASPLSRGLGALGILVLGLWISWSLSLPAKTPGFVLPSYPTRATETPLFKSSIINSGQPPRVHAASITELTDGRLCAAWFAGLREGGTEVSIDWACKGPEDRAWGPQSTLVTAARATKDTGLWVRKLGNPLLFQLPNGELWLIYVSVTLGGWSTSHLNLMRSQDLGQTWLPARRLWLTPFLNISTLVKGAPVFFDNGDIGLPLYHELAGVFPEFAILSPQGRLKTKARMDSGQHSLQPVILPHSSTEAIALMRDAERTKHRAWRGRTEDAGRHWQPLGQTELANPGSALAAVALQKGRILAVANDVEKDRRRLSLLLSEDQGRSWRVLHRFEDRESEAQPRLEAVERQLLEDISRLGASPDPGLIQTNARRNLCRHQDLCDWQYDYPYLIRDRQGDFHLVYSWNRSFIRHIQFNSAWLESLP